MAEPSRPDASEALLAAGRVNVDGVEGSSIPAGMHVARYGGGDDYRQASFRRAMPTQKGQGCRRYAAPLPSLPPFLLCRLLAGLRRFMSLYSPLRQVEPLLSMVSALPAREAPPWSQLRSSLANTTPASLRLIHGFSDAALLPGGAPPAAEVTPQQGSLPRSPWPHACTILMLTLSCGVCVFCAGRRSQGGGWCVGQEIYLTLSPRDVPSRTSSRRPPSQPVSP